MNIFNNTQSVTVHIKGTKTNDTTDGFDAKSAIVTMENTIYNKNHDERIKNIEKKHTRHEIGQKISDASIHELSVYNAGSKILENGKLLVFKDIITNIVLESLVVDDDTKPALENGIYGAVSEYIDNNGGYGMLLEGIRKSKSKLLCNIKGVCEKTAMSVSSRKMSEADASIDFSLTDTEKDEYEYSKSNINLDMLTELVKKKVVSVVLDEKKREENEKSIIYQLQDEAKDNEDIEDTKDRVTVDKSPTNESTLFNSIMRNSYKQILESSNGSTNINMDNVLLETITKYTIMETMHTMQLESFNVAKIMKMTNGLIN